MTTPATGQVYNINGAQINAAQMAALSAKGINVNTLQSLTSAQIQALLNGGAVNTTSFGNLTNTNALASALSGGGMPLDTNGNLNLVGTNFLNSIPQNPLVNSNAINANQMMQLQALISQAQAAGVNFNGVNLAQFGLTGGMGIMGGANANASLGAIGGQLLAGLGQAIAGLFKSDNTQNTGFVNNQINLDNTSADAVNYGTGIGGGLDNAINVLKATGKCPGAAQQVQAGKTFIGKIDANITNLTQEIATLEQQNKQTNELNKQNQEKFNKMDAAKQAKLNQFNTLDATYNDYQATADQLKVSYETVPDKTTDANGNTIENPRKAQLKQNWEAAQQKADEIKKQRDALKTELDKAPEMKSYTDTQTQIHQTVSQLATKKQLVNDMKETKKYIQEKISTLERLINTNTQ